MTCDDIILMAREVIPNSAAFELKGHYEIERFAALVAAHEREACAKACESLLDDGEDSYVVNRCLVVTRARGAA